VVRCDAAQPSASWHAHFDESQAKRFWRFLIKQNLVGADTPQLVVQLAFDVGNRLFDVAFERSPEAYDATITKRAVR
jgi:hypothetical protein